LKACRYTGIFGFSLTIRQSGGQAEGQELEFGKETADAAGLPLGQPWRLS
jgi:hypothetical protein